MQIIANSEKAVTRVVSPLFPFAVVAFPYFESIEDSRIVNASPLVPTL